MNYPSRGDDAAYYEVLEGASAQAKKKHYEEVMDSCAEDLDMLLPRLEPFNKSLVENIIMKLKERKK